MYSYASWPGLILSVILMIMLIYYMTREIEDMFDVDQGSIANFWLRYLLGTKG